MSIGSGGVTTGKDPTQAILSESGLDSKHLCDYVINVATGCRHGCKFCYVPSTPAVRTRPDMLKDHADVDNPQLEWGSYVLYRDEIPDHLDGILKRKQKWNETDQGCGVVGISFATDCYMDGRAGKITREVVRLLAKHGQYARVLTRNPILALQDLETFKQAGDYVTIGSSIPTMDAAEVASIEPRAPSPEHRLRGLREFSEAGVQTFVSMSPTYPTQSRSDLRAHLEQIAECDPAVIFHEPINPRGGNFEMTVEAARDAGETELARQLDSLRDRETWLSYSLEQFKAVQEIGEELDLPVHLWPDKHQINHANSDVSEWLQQWKDRQSPEEFADREIPNEPMPEIPSRLS
ncbi:radical SAM protein [Saliphagus sp. GCM10025334]|uniref:SPL family radical SAM protein n=1 Tax=Natronosalvus caseinilyticus TaxID=2953747 RepID=UPI0028A9FC50|nr:radical SAM protein [Natronosalvus caseinilyticus]